jgi:hypothetical protein
MMEVSRLIDEASCTRLCLDFMHHIDQRRYDRVVELFTEGGAFNRQGTVYRGRDAIQRLFEARPADVLIRHLCTNIRITIRSDNEAVGDCYAVFYKGRGGPDVQLPVIPSAAAVTEYHDTYVRTQDGWRIQERRTRPIFSPSL